MTGNQLNRLCLPLLWFLNVDQYCMRNNRKQDLTYVNGNDAGNVNDAQFSASITTQKFRWILIIVLGNSEQFLYKANFKARLSAFPFTHCLHKNH